MVSQVQGPSWELRIIRQNTKSIPVASETFVAARWVQELEEIRNCPSGCCHPFKNIYTEFGTKVVSQVPQAQIVWFQSLLGFDHRYFRNILQVLSISVSVQNRSTDGPLPSPPGQRGGGAQDTTPTTMTHHPWLRSFCCVPRSS